MPDVTIIDGKALAAGYKKSVSDQIASMTARGHRPPGLAVVLVGDNPASALYVRNKRKTAAHLGMNSYLHSFPDTVSQKRLLKVIADLNAADDVDGILVQLPLPQHLDAKTVIEAIAPDKDVDGLHPVNAGKLMLGRPGFVPCTPLGISKLIRSVRKDITGAHAVIIGASQLVGKPTAQVLLNAGCTITQAHSRSRDLPALTRLADILVVATGQAHLISADHVKEGTIIIDVGISRLTDGSLTGDVDFKDVTAHRNCAITPVPGGVGPMTIAMLMENTYQAAAQRAGL